MVYLKRLRSSPTGPAVSYHPSPYLQKKSHSCQSSLKAANKIGIKLELNELLRFDPLKNVKDEKKKNLYIPGK